MNSLRRFLDSISAVALVEFVISSFCILFGNNMIATVPIISCIGWGMQGLVVFIIIKRFQKLTKRENDRIETGVKYLNGDEDAVRRLGELRTCVEANKVKILLVTFFHVLILVYAVGIWALMAAKMTGVFDKTAFILMILAFLLGLLPLRHLGDYIEYYDNGFIYCGGIYFYQKVGGIAFKGLHSPRALAGTLMSVNGDTLDGSYLKNPKRKYYETYFYYAIDTLQGE